MGKIFQFPYEVAHYDTDLTGKMTLERLIAVTILGSEKQSKLLNRDANYLLPLGLGWVITQYEIVIHKMPETFDTVHFFTEATQWNKFFCYRNFWVENDAGEKLVEIQSTFVLMDLKTRKVKTVDEEIIAPFGGEKVNKIIRSEKIPQVTYEKSIPYRVRYFDLDVNQHVNNSKYFSWMLDPLGSEFLKSHQLKTVSIRFDQEVGEGMTIESRIHQEEKTTYHQIVTGDTLCTEARITWK